MSSIIKPLISQERPRKYEPSELIFLNNLRKQFPREQQMRRFMGRFVSLVAKYTQETDQILDLIGTNNAVITMEKVVRDGQKSLEVPKITLLDAMGPWRGLTFSGTRKLLEKAGGGGELSVLEKSYIKNTLHYARFMTVLAYEYAPENVSAFKIPELVDENVVLNVYKSFFKQSA